LKKTKGEVPKERGRGNLKILRNEKSKRQWLKKLKHSVQNKSQISQFQPPTIVDVRGEKKIGKKKGGWRGGLMPLSGGLLGG